VLLLDEPLSNLDPALRERTRRELRRAIRRVGITTVLVTHEQDEAFHLGDRVAVLEGGVLHQAGTPEELYDRPATRFVATFVGRASVLPGTFVGAGGGSAGLVRVDGVAAAGGGSAEGGREAAGAVAWWGAGGVPFAAGELVELVVRPEALALVPAGGPRGGALAGRVTEKRYAGPVTYYEVELAGTGLEVEVLGGPGDAAPGDPVAVGPRLPSPRPLPPDAPAAGAPAPAIAPVVAPVVAAPPATHQATAPATGRIFRRPPPGVVREGTP
jgi:iron(III) transport system ATP-binding protein